MNCSKDFFEMFWCVGVQLESRSSSNQFSKKFSFGANGQFWPNLGQNYATLYLMIGPKNFLEIWYDDRAQ